MPSLGILVKMDPLAVCPRDDIRERETEPHALLSERAGRLAAEERFEDPFFLGLFDARTEGGCGYGKSGINLREP